MMQTQSRFFKSFRLSLRSNEMKLNEVYEELTEEQSHEKAGKKDAC